ncbi:MAG TPA: preprotein translocase subunit YajC [Firmicutes bacterium]|nr:preprotein translocase subunit YajC [Bacillota bacterium]
MYFAMIRPQQQQQKKRNEMLASIKEGDKIVTVGGIYGYVTKVDKDTLCVRIAEKTEVEMQKSGVGAVVR